MSIVPETSQKSGLIARLRRKVAGRTRRRVPARGVLWLIALSLAGSALLRIGGETGQAIAREVAALPSGEPPATSDTACEPPPDIARVLALLAKRETALEAREAAAADRQQALAVAEIKIKEQMAALQTAEEELKSTLTLASRAAEDDVARLTSVYENMKPKEAAPVFAAMDPQFAAGFLARMRPEAAAAILSGLDPKDAYTISVVLAGRNANAPAQ